MGLVAVLVLSACGPGGSDGTAAGGGSGDCTGGDDLVVLTDGFNGDATTEALDPGATSLRHVGGGETTTKPSLSPDGRSVVVVRAEGDYESAGPDSTALWILDVGGGGKPVRELTDGSTAVDEPAWSPDGAAIAYSERVGVVDRLMVVDPVGGTPKVVLDPAGDGDSLPAWSPDGSRLAFIRRSHRVAEDGRRQAQLWTVGADGADPAEVAVVDSAVASVTWNPDGRTLLVGADREGLFEVDTEGEGTVTKVAESGSLPTWSRDGSRLYLVQDLPDPKAAPPPTAPGTPDDPSAGRYWAVVEARYDDHEVTPVRQLHDYGFLYGYYGLTVGPCRAGTVPTTVLRTGLPAATTTTTTPIEQSEPTCSAATAFADAVIEAEPGYGEPTGSPAELARLSDLTVEGVLTGGMETVPSEDGSVPELEVEVLASKTLVPEGGLEPGSLLVVEIPDADGVVAGSVDGVELRGLPVVLSALVSGRPHDDDRVHLALGKEGLATACRGGPPIGRVGAGPGWSGLSSLDDLAAASTT